MKLKLSVFLLILFIIPLNSCKQEGKTPEINIIYLHHSTGGVIWRGGNDFFVTKVARRFSNKLADIIDRNAVLPQLFAQYNKEHDKNYSIKELDFPKEAPYGWNNFPYDYYNIWVKNAGEEPYMKEPTLEVLTKDNEVIIFKHCFPVSNIKADQDTANINSSVRTISNYKLQYSALRDKLHQFPDTKFIIFTGAAQVKGKTEEEYAIRAKEFFRWVINEWDLPGDNIYLWDFYNIQTEGDLYFNNDYAVSSTNSHPNKDFAGEAVKLLFNRIIDIVENNGNGTTVTGKNR